MIVIDTNVLMSAIIKDGFTRRILVRSGSRFAYPEVALEEVKRHRPLLRQKSGYSEQELDQVLELLLRNVTIIATFAFQDELPRAVNVMREIDITDAVFVALALALNTSLWSDDAHMSKQTLVPILTTAVLAKKYP